MLVLRHVAGLTPLEIARHMRKTESSVHGFTTAAAVPSSGAPELEAAPVVQAGGAA